MQIFFWVILGLLAGGMVAILVKDTRTVMIFLDMMLGAVGALLGGIITHLLTLQNVMGLYDETMVVVVTGAGILIWLGRTLFIKNALF